MKKALGFAFICLTACGGNGNGTGDMATAQDLLPGPDLTAIPNDLAVSCGAAGAPCQTPTATNGLCDGAGTCADCNDPLDDANCNAAYAMPGMSFICVGGHCQAGECHTSLDCNGGLCAGGFCSMCTTSPVAVGDTACQSDAVYGAMHICLGGLCVPGNCHSDADCPAPLATTTDQICGIDTPNFCGACTDDTQCGAGTMCNPTTGACVSSACTVGSGSCETINSADHCCGPAGTGNANCQPGNCCGPTTSCGSGHTCSSNDIDVTGICSTCPAPTAGTVYVDPVGGSDTVGNGANSPGCAYQTVTKALQSIGHPTSATTIMVTGDNTVSLRMAPLIPREQVPITVPANVTVQAATGPIQMTVPNGAFRFAGGSSGLIGFNITASNPGQGVGLDVGFTPTGTVALTDVVVTGFQEGLVFKNPTVVNINPGVQLIDNGSVSLAGDGAQGDGTLNINAAALGGHAPVRFDGNSRYGIYGIGNAQVNITGDSTVPTVTANSNRLAGVFFNQSPGAPPSTMIGVVANDNVSGPGFVFHGGQALKLRKSIALGNVHGVQVLATGTSAQGNDIGNIDIGNSATPGGAGTGANRLQDAFSGNPNSGAGICVDIALTTTGIAGTLRAQGNVFSGPRDCATATPGTLSKSNDCTGGVDVSVDNPMVQATTVQIQTNNCN